MGMSPTVMRAVYLMSLALALLVALTSFMSGASFEAMVSRSMIALAGFALLGLMAILTLTPDSSPVRIEEEKSEEKSDSVGTEGGEEVADAA